MKYNFLAAIALFFMQNIYSADGKWEIITIEKAHAEADVIERLLKEATDSGTFDIIALYEKAGATISIDSKGVKKTCRKRSGTLHPCEKIISLADALTKIRDCKWTILEFRIFK